MRCIPLTETPPLSAGRYNQFFNTQTGATQHITQWVANFWMLVKRKGPTLLLEQVQCGGDGGGEGEDEDPHAGGGDAGGGAEGRTGLRMQTSPLPCPHLPTSRQPLPARRTTTTAPHNRRGKFGWTAWLKP